MNKQDIKNLLRENIFNKIREAGKNTEETSQDSGKATIPTKSTHKERTTKKDYNDVQNYFNKDLAFSQVDVMKKSLGWEDDEQGVNRSLFGKMLHQDKNDKGGLYQFDDEQLDKVRSAIKNKQ